LIRMTSEVYRSSCLVSKRGTKGIGERLGIKGEDVSKDLMYDYEGSASVVD
jgi:hypothetical protein